MEKLTVVAILQGLHPMITKCQLNGWSYVRKEDGWYEVLGELELFYCG